MKGQVSTPIAAAVFSLAVVVLIMFAVLKVESLPRGGYVAPLSQAEGAPARWIHIFYSNRAFWAVDAGVSSPSIAEIYAGINGTWVATFLLWPGSYNCTYNSSFLLNGRPISVDNPLRIGRDPYTGLWCPPPWSSMARCASGRIVSSMGRILVAKCIPDVST
ncbi:MAG: hypothetical protein QXP98_04635 [Thermoproteus sp.]